MSPQLIVKAVGGEADVAAPGIEGDFTEVYPAFYVVEVYAGKGKACRQLLSQKAHFFNIGRQGRNIVGRKCGMVGNDIGQKTELLIPETAAMVGIAVLVYPEVFELSVKAQKLVVID